MRAVDRHAGKGRQPPRATHHPHQRRRACEVTAWGTLQQWANRQPEEESLTLTCGELALAFPPGVCCDQARAARVEACVRLRPRGPGISPPGRASVGVFARDERCVMPPPRCAAPTHPPRVQRLFYPGTGMMVALPLGASHCPPSLV